MLHFNIIDIFNIIAAFQLLLFSIFLLNLKKGNKLSHKVLAVSFIAAACCIINTLTWHQFSFFYKNCPHFFFTSAIVTFLWGPSIYFYTKSITNKNFTFKKIHLLNLLPFITYTAVVTLRFFIHNAELKRTLLDQGIFNNFEIHVITNGINIINLVYITISIHVIQKYRSEIKKELSSIEQINLSWLLVILWGYFLTWIISISEYIINLQNDVSISLDVINYMIIFVLANFMVYKGLIQPEIFTPTLSKYKKSPLTAAKIKSYHLRLLKYMESEKPYLNSFLTLDELSKKLSIPSHYLSQVINSSLNQNFYDFINLYRIKESKKLLSDKSNHDKTILEILYEAGFNSKSAFNRFFKESTGLTPTEFRNQQNHSI